MISIRAGFIALAMVASTAASAQTLRIGLAEDPDALDPTLARTYVGRIVFASLCDKLFDIDEKVQIVPQLALGQETSADGKSMTIKLRPGVKFHDGEPLDAASVKYSLERHMTMQGSFRRPELSEVDNVEVVDPTTVKLNLKRPFSPLLAQLADRSGMIVSPKAAAAAGDKFGLQPVCAGPFKFVERVQQDRIVLEKFADYWDKDKITLQRVIFRTITESSVRLANLKSGDLDMIERALATDLKEMKADPKLKVLTLPDLGYMGITVNVGKGEPAKAAFANLKIRQALAAAIDRKAINDVVFNGEALPGNQWINPTNAYYQTKYPVPERNIAKAKALMQEAGVKTPLAIDFMVPNNPETRQAAEVIQAMAAEAGFDMKIRVTEFATSLKEAEDGRYQAYMLNWSGRADPDGNIYIFHKTGGPQNYGGYSDPEADALLDEGRTKNDPAERKAIYEKLAGKLLSEGSIIYIYHRPVIIAYNTKVSGYKQLPDGLIRLQGVAMK